MELFGLISTILLALVLVALARTALHKLDKTPRYGFLLRLFRRKKQPIELPSMQRMFVAIRRQSEGRKVMMIMPAEEYEKSRNQAILLLNDLVNKWDEVAQYEWGFHGSEYGLSSSNEENWMLFASFVVKNHDVYRLCLAMLQAEEFLPLRKQFDIRLQFGELMPILPPFAIELFRHSNTR